MFWRYKINDSNRALWCFSSPSDSREIDDKSSSFSIACISFDSWLRIKEQSRKNANGISSGVLCDKLKRNDINDINNNNRNLFRHAHTSFCGFSYSCFSHTAIISHHHRHHLTILKQVKEREKVSFFFSYISLNARAWHDSHNNNLDRKKHFFPFSSLTFSAQRQRKALLHPFEFQLYHFGIEVRRDCEKRLMRFFHRLPYLVQFWRFVCATRNTKVRWFRFLFVFFFWWIFAASTEGEKKKWVSRTLKKNRLKWCEKNVFNKSFKSRKYKNK